ncbi:MAG TPA: hypothetical protein VE442_11540 [Jatrophihabitans sp.]|jgi:hypothetical protein|nr:hypothetical protein [Jatrophihabitans sp.]
MSRNVLMLCTGLAAVALIAGCSASGNATARTSGASLSVLPAPRHSQVAHRLSSSPPAPSSAATGELSGSWRGRYSGAYSGTFKLSWQQSGAKLRGTIHLSTPNYTLPINGKLSGGTISFGTVGSLAITYSGSVSADSMSGNYQVHASGSSDGGPWSATKA